MRLGPYELLREIGRGGQGVVYQARDTRHGNEVAIKTLAPGRGADLRTMERMRREATATAELRHRSICPIHELGEVEGRPFLVMDYLEGATLAQRIRATRDGGDAGLPRDLAARARFALELVEEIARAAHAAHEHGVIHRDLKPANVMLLEDGRAMLLDFGLASGDGQPITGSIRTAEVVGTPAYLAPEQVLHGGSSRAADIHALGALLYETLQLESPFKAPTRAGLCREILRRDVRLPEHVCQVVGHGLAAVVETALAKEPSQRYSSAQDLADDLGRLRSGAKPHARRAGALLRFRRWTRHHRGVSVALSACLVAVFVAIGIVAALVRETRATRAELQRFVDRGWLAELLEEEAARPWPLLPAGVAPMLDWVEDAQALYARRHQHAAFLETLGAGSERVRMQHFLADLGSLPARISAVLTFVRAAESLGARTLEAFADSWHTTLTELADSERSPRYGGLVMQPQLGLVPLGRDPQSGLFEFAHEPTGRLPARDAEGRLSISADTGFVFVLLPAGTFVMGAERPAHGRSAGEANVDPHASAWEAPIQRVRLDAFFLSKYEVTRAQWLRLTGEIDSYTPEWTREKPWRPAIGPTHPAYGLSWRGATDIVARYGLSLPTEAQWEYGARAGTVAVWSSGWDKRSLRGSANLADLAFSRYTRPLSAGLDVRSLEWMDVDDGYALTAPIDSLAANAFGLHHVHGNMTELVRDALGPYTLPVALGDGERLGGNPDVRTHRGGNWDSTPLQARSAARADTGPDSKYLGLRPARAIWK